jgi:hypothetical protein
MRRWMVLVVLGAVLCAGCKVDATTAIQLRPDGGGRVTVRVRFDKQAVGVVERGGGKLEDRIVLTDLSRSGWRVSPWVRSEGGSATLHLSHEFRNGDELGRVVAQVAGSNGVLRDVHETRTRNMLQQRDGVSLVADLGVLKSGVRDDKEVAARLRAAGVNVDAVDFILAQQLRKAFSLRVTLSVPRNKTRSFSIAAGERQTVNLSATRFEANRFAVLLIGAMLVFLSLLLYLSASISARRRRARALEFAAVRARRGSQPVM